VSAVEKAAMDAHAGQVPAGIAEARPAPAEGAPAAARNTGRPANGPRVLLPGQGEKTARALR
jgi:hypothetical protein